MTTKRENEYLRIIFQLTSSQGGWLFCSWCVTSHLFFNSHPHKEDDEENKLYRFYKSFSTHILTRRMTWKQKKRRTKKIFSTHILTRRMTATLNKNTLSKTARIIPFEYNTLKIYIFSNSYLLFFWKSTPFSGANLPENFCALIIRTKISKYP